MTSLLSGLGRGAVAGAVATIPMSVVMLAGQKAGMLPKQPPEEIVDSALDAAGAHVSKQTSSALATLNHFAFGAGIGAGYSLLRRITGGRGNPSAVGSLFALGVWFASYQGWVPALTGLPRTTDDRSDRQTTMAAAHVAYGVTLGALVDRLGANPS